MNYVTQARRLRQLLRLCRKYMDESGDRRVSGGQADSALHAIMRLAIDHASAVHALAEKSFHFASPSLCCARAAFQAGTIATWIGTPELPFEREGRWIGHFRGLGKFYEKHGAVLELNMPGIKRDLKAAFDTVNAAFEQVLQAQPGIRVVGTPDIRSILKAADAEHLYAAYQSASEIIHIGPEAIIRSRQKAKDRAATQRIEEIEWTNSFNMAAWGAVSATYFALLRNTHKHAQLQPLLDEQSRFKGILGDG